MLARHRQIVHSNQEDVFFMVYTVARLAGVRRMQPADTVSVTFASSFLRVVPLERAAYGERQTKLMSDTGGGMASCFSQYLRLLLD